MSSTNISIIFSLTDACKSYKTGIKAVNLSKLAAAGFAVPKGFVIAADAYRSHIWSSGALELIQNANTRETHEKIRKAIVQKNISEDVSSAVARYYERLSWQCGIPEPNIVVRASVVDEGALNNWPDRIYESRRGISGIEDLLTAIKKSWASVWSDKAVAYRAEAEAEEPAMAIIIQLEVDADRYGTVKTANPLTGDPWKVILTKQADIPTVAEINLCDEDISDPAVEKAILAEDILGKGLKIEWASEKDYLWIIQAGQMENLPIHFPAPEVQNGKWARISDKPVSPLSRDLLWQIPHQVQDPFKQSPGDKRQLINGYAYRLASNIDYRDISEDGKALSRNIVLGTQTLSRWKQEAKPHIQRSLSQLNSLGLAEANNKTLAQNLSKAVSTTRTAAEWLEIAAYPCKLFPLLLHERISGLSQDNELFWKLLEGLPDPVIMRDAKLQEFGDRFAMAEKLGKLDAKWWNDYQKEVRQFAREAGYAFSSEIELWDISQWRSWIEDKDAVFRMIAASGNESRPSLLITHSTAEATAHETSEKTAETMSGKTRAEFKDLLQLSGEWQCAYGEIEESYALACSVLKLILAEIASRLCNSGQMTHPEDIFYLTLEEIPGRLKKPSDKTACAALIAERKHQQWLEGRLKVPSIISPEGMAFDNPAIHGNLAGTPASPGTAKGKAFVIHSTEQAVDIEEGSIVVVKSPMSAWTPFLAKASGFISEEEISLARDILLLREYGIPAITGCRGILKSISTGDRLSINGSTGQVIR